MMIQGVLSLPRVGTKNANIEFNRHVNNKNLRFQGFTLPRPLNTRIGGWSLEDFTSRVMVWLIYIPQGIMAIMNRQVPFETWGRNTSAWLSTTGITSLAKNPQYGFNALFNQLIMLPKSKNPQSNIDKWFNRFRLKDNYLELLNEAGINLKKMGFEGDFTRECFDKAAKKKAFWSDLSVTEKMLLDKLKLLAKAQKKLSKVRLIEQIQKRMAVCKMSSIGVSAVIMALVVGVLLQKAIFKFISPLDRKFVPKTGIKTAPTQYQNKGKEIDDFFD